MTLPWSITAMPSAELVGLVEVLSAQQDRRPLRRQRAHDVPHLVARARVQARGGLVEEQQLGRDDDARGDVEPTPHAARVVLDQAAGGVGQAEGLEQLGRARLRLGAAQAEQPREQDEVLPACQVLVDRGQLAREADDAAHVIGLANDVVPEHARRPGVRAQQRGQHLDGGRLAGAVRPEDAVDRAAGDREIDAVDGARRAEVLHEARGLDGEGGSCAHLWDQTGGGTRHDGNGPAPVTGG
jgi:hypothetical protein